jgi:dTDP-4-dehydrorhamnose 3,5-epimerase
MSQPIPVKDSQTVTPDGKTIGSRIDGLIIHPEVHIVEPRGELVEIYSPAWGLHTDPLIYAYQVRVRVGSGRGWVVHKVNEDRLHLVVGTLHWAFFDDRPESPTYKMLNKYTVGERNSFLIIIPKGVYHACMNVGDVEAIFINLPTTVYNHADPDKYRLPLKNDLIPYDFSDMGPR